VGLVGKLQRLQHGELVAVSGLNLLVGRLPRLAGHQLLGLEGLELDRVGPGGDGGVDQSVGQFL
jgi:hypothetical protein